MDAKAEALTQTSAHDWSFPVQKAALPKAVTIKELDVVKIAHVGL